MKHPFTFNSIPKLVKTNTFLIFVYLKNTGSWWTTWTAARAEEAEGQEVSCRCPIQNLISLFMRRGNEEDVVFCRAGNNTPGCCDIFAKKRRLTLLISTRIAAISAISQVLHVCIRYSGGRKKHGLLFAAVPKQQTPAHIVRKKTWNTFPGSS